MTRVSKSLPTGAIAKARRSEPRGSRRRGRSDHLVEGGFTGATRVAGKPVARRSASSGNRRRTRLWRRSRRIVRGSAPRKGRRAKRRGGWSTRCARGSVTRQRLSSSFAALAAAKGPSRVAGSGGNGEESRRRCLGPRDRQEPFTWLGAMRPRLSGSTQTSHALSRAMRPRADADGRDALHRGSPRGDEASEVRRRTARGEHNAPRIVSRLAEAGPAA